MELQFAHHNFSNVFYPLAWPINFGGSIRAASQIHFSKVGWINLVNPSLAAWLVDFSHAWKIICYAHLSIIQQSVFLFPRAAGCFRLALARRHRLQTQKSQKQRHNCRRDCWWSWWLHYTPCISRCGISINGDTPKSMGLVVWIILLKSMIRGYPHSWKPSTFCHLGTLQALSELALKAEVPERNTPGERVTKKGWVLIQGFGE